MSKNIIRLNEEAVNVADLLIDGCENSIQRRVILAFVHKVSLWNTHTVITLPLNNTQETVTFEEIREFEQLSVETQKPLPDCAESGMETYIACNKKSTSARLNACRGTRLAPPTGLEPVTP